MLHFTVLLFDSIARFDELQFRRDCDGRSKRSVHRAAVVKDAVNTVGRVAVRRRRPELQPDMNTPDYQDTVLLLHLACRLTCQPAFGCGDLTRFQRASIGSDQSTGRGCHDVVQCRRMRLNVGSRTFEVMLSDSAVNPERHGFRLSRQKRPS